MQSSLHHSDALHFQHSSHLFSIAEPMRTWLPASPVSSNCALAAFLVFMKTCSSNTKLHTFPPPRPAEATGLYSSRSFPPHSRQEILKRSLLGRAVGRSFKANIIAPGGSAATLHAKRKWRGVLRLFCSIRGGCNMGNNKARWTRMLKNIQTLEKPTEAAVRTTIQHTSCWLWWCNAFHFSTWEAKASGCLWVWGQPGLHSEVQSSLVSLTKLDSFTGPLPLNWIHKAASQN